MTKVGRQGNSGGTMNAEKNAVYKSSPTTFRNVIDQRVYIAQHVDFNLTEEYRSFHTRALLQYHALCDDFGPMNMVSIIRFIEALDAEMAAFPAQRITYFVDDGRRALTNAVFLLGAYMIIKRNSTAAEVSQCFDWLDQSQIEPYRDATFEKPDFHLTLKDCWSGLERGRNLGWVRAPAKDGIWGKIEVDEYEHYDDPLNADLHEVVPGKFVAFKGPKDLNGMEYRDDKLGYRMFSPEYYLDIFKMLGVSSVVRLNEPEYDAEAFEAHSIRHHDLEFEDCSAPPAAVAAEFLRIADGARGVVAVHCKAGLGRTGTLIALYLMRTHGFSGREAMGWLRIMRPGSVIGEQQHFLCAAAGVTDNTFATTAARSRSLTPPQPNKSQCSVLAAQVAAGMQRQAAARIQASSGGSRRHSQA